MTKPTPEPGVSRQQGLSEHGLERLELLLARGAQLSQPVLRPWIDRHGWWKY